MRHVTQGRAATERWGVQMPATARKKTIFFWDKIFFFRVSIVVQKFRTTSDFATSQIVGTGLKDREHCAASSRNRRVGEIWEGIENCGKPAKDIPYGVLRVAHGCSGAKALPLAARPSAPSPRAPTKL